MPFAMHPHRLPRTQRTRSTNIGGLILALFLGSFLFASVPLALCNDIEVDAQHTKGARVISKEELAVHNGKDRPELWISILGEVYDVTQGAEYYGEGAPYRVFVGRDGSAAFVTGNFTPAAAEGTPVSSLTPHQMGSISSWRDFYAKEAKYPFVGVLNGVFYDQQGNPTADLESVRVAAAEAQIAMEEKKRIIQERVAERKREKAAKDQEKLAAKVATEKEL